MGETPYDGSMQVVVLAGGLGTRLRPLTDNFPKSLIEVAGHPFLAYLLRYLEAQGATKITIVAGFKAGLIQEFLRKHKSNIPIELLDEGQELRGTAGAIKWVHGQGKLESQFSLTWGDALLLIDYSQVWKKFRQERSDCLMTVFKNENTWGASNVVMKDGVITLYDKKIQPKPPDMTFIDYGFLVFDRSIVESWPATTPLDLNEPLRALSVKGRLAGLEVFHRFYEIGSREGIKDLEDFLRSEKGRGLFDFENA